jgi:tetratricopeptide (TPR) repeat protein
MNANGIDFKTCYLSEPGVFVKNKGCFIFQELDRFAFWLVVDGVEFLPGKDSIEVIVDQLCIDLAASPGLSRGYIRKCLHKAHSSLKNAGNGLSLKASLVLAVSDYAEMIWAVSGNSRLYLIRERQIAFRSRDQSVAQLLVESDIINEDSMTSVADRDILTNYLGIDFGFAPYISNRYKLQDGDIIILCNLGFWEQLHTETFEQLLQTVPDSTALLPIFKERFLERDSMVLNNYIVGLVAVRHALNSYKSKKFQFHFHLPFDQKQIAIFLAVLLGICGVIAVGVNLKSKFLNNKTQLTTVQTQNLTQAQIRQNNITAYERNGDRLVRKEKYLEANAEYYKALNILNAFPDKDTEGEIKVKISISLMLKGGDSFFAKKDYTNALKRYKTALNNDTPNYFRSKTENKLAKVRQILDSLPDPTPSSVIAPTEKPEETDLANNQVAKPTPTPVKLAEKIPVKSPISREESRKPAAVVRKTGRITANSGGNTKNVVKPIKSIKSNEPVKLKSASPITTNSQPNNGDALSVNRGLLLKATALIKKGDELVRKRKFRQGVICYKKAQNIYNKISMGAKATQLDVRIEVAKNKMRASFEGSR